jgi:ABC-type bacteriocin/lantibiotic exporter with double-glycine peptidase domain
LVFDKYRTQVDKPIRGMRKFDAILFEVIQILFVVISMLFIFFHLLGFSFTIGEMLYVGILQSSFLGYFAISAFIKLIRKAEVIEKKLEELMHRFSPDRDRDPQRKSPSKRKHTNYRYK